MNTLKKMIFVVVIGISAFSMYQIIMGDSDIWQKIKQKTTSVVQAPGKFIKKWQAGKEAELEQAQYDLMTAMLKGDVEGVNSVLKKVNTTDLKEFIVKNLAPFKTALLVLKDKVEEYSRIAAGHWDEERTPDEQAAARAGTQLSAILENLTNTFGSDFLNDIKAGRTPKTFAQKASEKVETIKEKFGEAAESFKEKAIDIKEDLERAADKGKELAKVALIKAKPTSRNAQNLIEAMTKGDMPTINDITYADDNHKTEFYIRKNLRANYDYALEAVRINADKEQPKGKWTNIWNYMKNYL